MTEETNKASGEDVLALPTLPHPMLMPPLVIEAGTVYHETGLTPRQLAEQRDELLASLKCMVDKFEGRCADYENAEWTPEYNTARAIIAKVEAKQ